MSDINAINGINYYNSLLNNTTGSTLNSILGSSNLNNDGLLNSLSGINSDSNVSDFSNILQSYLSGVNNTTTNTTATDTLMQEKLYNVLQTASKTEDTNSLTYKTVQEVYDYFSKQVSTKMNQLGLSDSSMSTQNTVANTKTAEKSVQTDSFDQMNQNAMQGKEIDFDDIDKMIDSSFAESTPME